LALRVQPERIEKNATAIEPGHFFVSLYDMG
jgi:hypothetical protein